MTDKPIISCNTCRLWQVKEGGQDGICRRHAPKPAIVLPGSAQLIWPATKPSEWCGEWRPLSTNQPKE